MMTKKRGFNWLRDKTRHGLIIYGLSNRLARIGIEIVPFYWEKEYVKTCKSPQIKGNPNDYVVKKLNPDDLKIIFSLDSNFSLHEKQKLLNNGQICIGLIHSDKIVAYSFIELSGLNFRSLNLKFSSNESYLGGMQTMKEYRGKNLATFLRFHIYQFLIDREIDTIYSISDYFNKPAIKFKSKLNSKHEKLYLYINLFNRFEKVLTLKAFV